MIFSENQLPLFGIMLQDRRNIAFQRRNSNA